MSKINRKKFLQYSALASGSLFIPKFLQGLDTSKLLSANNNQNKLIVIQLSGGNDGLNTFIPYKNDLYYKLRTTLAIPESQVLKVNPEIGFNPGMTAMKKLYDQGDLCIINNVGYPNPDKSHFRSMDIWTTGSGSDQYFDTGWIGRYLDANCIDCNHAHTALEVDETLGLALKGAYQKGLAINDPARLYRATRDPFFKEMMDLKMSTLKPQNNSDYLYKTLVETTNSVSYIYQKSKIYKSTEEYPNNAFGKNLKLISELICSGSNTKIYYISLSGFDTHARQQPTQEKLLKVVSDSMFALIKDLKKNNLFDETLIMAFSEFGRRVQQNGSNGTDHGAANNLIIAGGSLTKKGFYNEAPDLEHLSQGSLQFQTDYRSIYATILNNWLKVDADKIIGSKFQILNFV